MVAASYNLHSNYSSKMLCKLWIFSLDWCLFWGWMRDCSSDSSSSALTTLLWVSICHPCLRNTFYSLLARVGEIEGLILFNSLTGIIRQPFIQTASLLHGSFASNPTDLPMGQTTLSRTMGLTMVFTHFFRLSGCNLLYFFLGRGRHARRISRLRLLRLLAGNQMRH